MPHNIQQRYFAMALSDYSIQYFVCRWKILIWGGLSQGRHSSLYCTENVTFILRIILPSRIFSWCWVTLHCRVEREGIQSHPSYSDSIFTHMFTWHMIWILCTVKCYKEKCYMKHYYTVYHIYTTWLEVYQRIPKFL